MRRVKRVSFSTGRGLVEFQTICIRRGKEDIRDLFQIRGDDFIPVGRKAAFFQPECASRSLGLQLPRPLQPGVVQRRNTKPQFFVWIKRMFDDDRTEIRFNAVESLKLGYDKLPVLQDYLGEWD